MFTEQSLQIVRYCAEEVGRQYNHRHADPKQAAHAVGWMVRAWIHAQRCFNQQWSIPTLEQIEQLGALVEPGVNAGGFRKIPVRVGPNLCPAVKDLPDLLARYVEMLPHLPHTEKGPETAYLEFERIHPFCDGNGRVGKIILNWVAGTLDRPFATPIPNPWGILNP